MAFQIVEQDRIAQRSGGGGRVAVPTALRRPIAAGLSVLVTSAMLWTLISRLVAAVEPAHRPDTAALKMFTVANPSDTPRPRAEPVAKSASAPPPRTPVVPPLPPVPAEWTTARIRVAIPVLPAPSEISVPAPAIASGPAGATGSASAGGGGYDPYAGATPMRREGPVTANGLASQTASVDRSMLEAIHGMLRARVPGLRGQVMILVVVTPDGRASSIERLQGSVGSKADEMLSELLRTFGRFPPTGKNYRLRLPAFTF